MGPVRGGPRHAEQNPGHLIVSTMGQPTFCGHGDYRDPLLDLTAVKYAGTETQTDEGDHP